MYQFKMGLFKENFKMGFAQHDLDLRPSGPDCMSERISEFD